MISGVHTKHCVIGAYYTRNCFLSPQKTLALTVWNTRTSHTYAPILAVMRSLNSKMTAAVRVSNLVLDLSLVFCSG